MKQPTYKEQFDKLTRAYINDEVRHYSPCACFVGNLLNNTTSWIFGRRRDNNVDKDFLAFTSTQDKKTYYEQDQPLSWSFTSIYNESGGLYAPQEVYDIEKIFMRTFETKIGELGEEEALFLSFSLALDALKALHISKGEQIEETPLFIKRTLHHENSHV